MIDERERVTLMGLMWRTDEDVGQTTCVDIGRGWRRLCVVLWWYVARRGKDIVVSKREWYAPDAVVDMGMKILVAEDATREKRSLYAAARQ